MDIVQGRPSAGNHVRGRQHWPIANWGPSDNKKYGVEIAILCRDCSVDRQATSFQEPRLLH